MAKDQYTHRFEFRIGDDGSKYLVGQMEFDTDDAASFKLTNTSEPLQEETLRKFMEWIAKMHEIFNLYEGIKEIKLVKIE